jgi:hypothetical protein
MQTIQLKLFKIGARVKELQTRIKVELPTAFPHQEIFHSAYQELSRTAGLRC